MLHIKIMKEIKYWSQIFLFPIYALSHLFPRSKEIWVLGSTFGKRFADNPKYFYLYLNQFQKDDINAVWISKSRKVVDFLCEHKYPAYYLYTLKGIWYCLRAKVYLYDNYTKDICFPLSGGAIKINMWHGIPLKKIQKDNIFDRIRNPQNIKEKLYSIPRKISDEKPSHYVLTTSEKLRGIFSSAFITNNVLICGYPRNDFLNFNLIHNVQMIEEEKSLNEFTQWKGQTILYMPTFRDTESTFFDVINMNTFHSFLKKNELLFCVKLHPKSKNYNKFAKFSMNFNNVLLISSEFDPYPYLNKTDLLVTDYSSIYFDFLYKDKPIIFFNYDYEEYIHTTRELYFDYNQMTPGQKVKDEKELIGAIKEELFGIEKYKEDRMKMKESMLLTREEPSSEVLYKRIKNICDLS